MAYKQAALSAIHTFSPPTTSLHLVLAEIKTHLLFYLKLNFGNQPGCIQMNISLGHKSRNPGRDHKADYDRLARITASLSAIIEEITSEETGLRMRYESETADASFLELAEESEGSSPKLNSRLEDVTTSILQSEKRLETLRVQLAFWDETRSSIERKFKT